MRDFRSNQAETRTWLAGTVLMATLLIVGAASAALAANSVAATAAAAMGAASNFGGEFTADASANGAYLVTSSPKGPGNEISYSFDFLFRPNTLVTNGKQWVVMKAWEFAPFEVRLEMRIKEEQASPGTFRVALFVYEDDGLRRFVGKYNVQNNGPSRIGVNWLAASGPGMNDGVAQLTRGGVVQKQLTDVDNDTHQIDTARYGYVHGASFANINGSFYLDDFNSFR